jgi:DNA-binding MarR family transcriptional regulator
VATTEQDRRLAHDTEFACAQAWAALTAAHARIAERLTAALRQACGIGISDFEILLRLDQVPTPGLRLGELATAVQLTQPALSRAAVRLEQRGWLTRASAANDRRGVLVAITGDGRAALRRAAPVHAQVIGQFLIDPLTPGELDPLARALARIADA